MYVPEWEMKAAQSAYEGYCEYTGWKSIVTGSHLPEWDDLPGQIKNAWHSAIKKAFNEYHTSKEV